jgi:hypothetical protein
MAIGETIATVLISGTVGSVVTKTIDWLRSRSGDKAGVADRISASAIKLVEAAQQNATHQIELARLEVQAARMDAAEARNEAAAARSEATQARREAMFAVATLRSRDLAILSPYATLESLRELVQAGPNGFGGASVHYGEDREH